jgi:hypothetical protein
VSLGFPVDTTAFEVLPNNGGNECSHLSSFTQASTLHSWTEYYYDDDYDDDYDDVWKVGNTEYPVVTADMWASLMLK